MNALAMTALAHLNGSLGTLHSTVLPFFAAVAGLGGHALYFELYPCVAANLRGNLLN